MNFRVKKKYLQKKARTQRAHRMRKLDGGQQGNKNLAVEMTACAVVAGGELVVPAM